MYKDELSVAIELAQKAGKLMREYSAGAIEVELKQDQSPVTYADKAINDLVIERITEVFPTHSVIGEEASNIQPGQAFVWSCDPIDGTIAFIHRFPTSMFSLALLHEGSPVVAVAYNPWTDEMFTAIKGEGAFLNGKKLAVSHRSLAEATLATAATLSVDKVAKIDKLRRAVPDTTHLNAVVGAVFAGTRVASGDVDGYIFYYSGAHDMATSKLIVEEAGGRVTDLAGNEQRYDQPINGAIVSNGIIHAELQATL
jgi:myo-inositol-1(or 4)-monophosphatase